VACVLLGTGRYLLPAPCPPARRRRLACDLPLFAVAARPCSHICLLVCLFACLLVGGAVRVRECGPQRPGAFIVAAEPAAACCCGKLMAVEGACSVWRAPRRVEGEGKGGAAGELCALRRAPRTPRASYSIGRSSSGGARRPASAAVAPGSG
jgi:hypothetical protein